jgi:hypothetical protein
LPELAKSVYSETGRQEWLPKLRRGPKALTFDEVTMDWSS